MSLSTPLTPEEKQLYSHLFRTLDPQRSGLVSGEKARATFEKSGLSPAVLGEIWQLADTANTGTLSQLGFCVAMRLIGHVQATGLAPASEMIDRVGPLPTFAGIAFAPSSIATVSRTSSVNLAPLPPITPVEIQNFATLFRNTARGPVLAGATARDIFMKAKLPMPVLGSIWNLVDVNNAGELSIDEFVLAMYLIQNSLNGKVRALPETLPEYLWTATRAGTGAHADATLGTRDITPSHQTSDWVISPQFKQQYDAVFASLKSPSSDHLTPDVVANYLMSSNLPQDMLATVWDLADIYNTGEFSPVEFAVACFLVKKVKEGVALPDVVEESLIRSASTPSTTTNANATSNLNANTTNLNANTTNLNVSANASANATPAQSRYASSSSQNTSSFNDLVDLSFSKPTPQAAESTVLPGPAPSSQRVPTGKFMPSSSFGQSLATNNAGASSPADTNSTVNLNASAPANVPASVPVPANAPAFSASASSSRSASSSTIPQTSSYPANINYDALRAVPPPPVRNQAPPAPEKDPQFQRRATSSGFGNQYVKPVASTNTSNSDLLADPDSAQLSAATTDIANLSTQVSSLSQQTTGLHEKRSKVESELAQILSFKAEIESKLAKLHAAYDREKITVAQVEQSLSAAKTETESLRQEASLVEAQLNTLQLQLQQNQMALEEQQKANASLKEQIGNVNAEKAELSREAETAERELKLSTAKAEVAQSQLSVAQSQYKAMSDRVAQQKAQHAATLQRAAQLEEEKARIVYPEPFVPPIAKEPSVVPAEGVSAKGVAVGVAAAVGATLGASETHTKETSDADFYPETGFYESKNEFASSDYPNAEFSNDFSTFDTSNPFFGSGANSRNASTVEYPTSEVKYANVEDDDSSVGRTVVAGSSGDAPSSTAASSPPNSDFSPGQFQQLNLIRPQSVTSSVQNNAGDSVRGDFDENDRETVKDSEEVAEEVAAPEEVLAREVKPEVSPEGSSKTLSEIGFPVVMPGSFPGALPEVESEVPATSAHAVVETEEPEAFSRASDTESASSHAESDLESDVVTTTVPESPHTAHGAFEAPLPPIPTSRDTSSHISAQTSSPDSFEMVEKAELSDGFSFDHAASDDLYHKSPADDSTIRLPSSEEFPPMRELDYDESDSSEEPRDVLVTHSPSVRGSIANSNEFADAFEDLPTSLPAPKFESDSESKAVASETFPQPSGLDSQPTSSSDFARPAHPFAPQTGDFDFDDAFSNLEPAAPEAKSLSQSDNFQDAFAGLEQAPEDTDDFAEDAFNANFTNDFFGDEPFSNNPFPASQEQPTTGTASDEWDQLFAGFGNAQVEEPLHSQPPPVSPRAASGASPAIGAPLGTDFSLSNKLAIEELVGMGFDEESAVNALRREDWNMEDATNYLLDNA